MLRHLVPRLGARPVAGLWRGAAVSVSRQLATEAGPEILVTERCAKRINKLREDDPELCLRVEVDGGGCQGFQYVFKLDSLKNISKEEDRLFEKNGATVVVDSGSLELLGGSQVDFKSDLIGSAFVVGSNPHAEASCGCKRSFTIK
eukprot:comp12845_c0_seq1/m.8011 comp12845_c0_seq1/g.8011  ORF comp12845_c0_seq1/g.8011 comp12845_c0_seq1/m.8011 type:complete len:146 (-) comp12845_c0_seq1:295-732(-)